MLRPALVCVVLVFLVATPPPLGAEEPTADVPQAPDSWLVIEPVDQRARRPFNPDAVFHRYLLDRSSVPPGEGTVVKGSAREAAWRRVTPDDKGRVGGPIAWAYGEVTSDRDRIVMAALRSGATLFVNGTPHVGAIYGDRFEVPVKLRKGKNEVYVRGVRGAFTLTFSEPPAPVFLAPFRQTKPDLVAGEPFEQPMGLLVVNATEQTLPAVQAQVAGTAWLGRGESPALPVPPLGLVQLRLPLETRPDAVVPMDVDKLSIRVSVSAEGIDAPFEAEVELRVDSRDDATIRTFRSAIDDSVQRFGMRRPLPRTGDSDGTAPRGLVLSLHGAGVNPRGQARAYSRKEDFWLFAPTNRDRFGFDWQDWGRLDAYEVLAEGLRISGVPRDRVYLTGHSMGGHGTWHLGANDPDGFAAIAPSAGWISFETYGGPRPKDKHVETWHAADAASLTRNLIDNLIQLPTYVLHGTKDRNVPAAQAQEMLRHLTAAGAMPSAWFEPGAGHWWDGYQEPGAACVDWPGFFKLFRKTRIPRTPNRIRFTTVHPGVDHKHHWVEVLQVVEYGKPARVEARWRPKTKAIEVRTQNVKLLKIAHPERPESIEINGEAFGADNQVHENADPFWWEQEDGGPGRLFELLPMNYRSMKRPSACGPFKQAWRNGFVFVYGTKGSPEETTALEEQARFDAQRWMYRANGQTIVVRDVDYAAVMKRLEGARNAVLYGSTRTNAAFEHWREPYPRLHGRSAVTRTGGRSGGRASRRGPEVLLHGPARDIGCCTLGRSKDGKRLCAIIGSTGVPASRAGFGLMLFVSGAGWPDYTVWTSDVALRGDDAVIATGFLDRDWRIPAED